MCLLLSVSVPTLSCQVLLSRSSLTLVSLYLLSLPFLTLLHSSTAAPYLRSFLLDFLQQKEITGKKKVIILIPFLSSFSTPIAWCSRKEDLQRNFVLPTAELF